MSGEVIAVPPKAKGKAGPICKTCSHPQVEMVNAALIAGEGIRPIAAQYGLTKQSVARHRDNCVPSEAAQAGAIVVIEAETTQGATLAEQAAQLRDKALDLLRKSEAAGDLRTRCRAFGKRSDAWNTWRSCPARSTTAFT